ncbi:MAG: ATP-binding protein [Ferruginibacter sp.]
MESAIIKAQFKETLLQAQLEIQEQTFKNISQEIHDNIGQVLGVAKINLNTLTDISGEKNLVKVKDTKELLSKAIRDLRDLSRSMHGDRIAELGLVNACEAELKILENTGQYETALAITGEVYKLDPQKEMLIFRIIQEAIHNCVKHAEASKINVGMNYDPNYLSINITDNGKGFDINNLQASQKGVGLKSMQNRAVLINASISIDSVSGKGASIIFSLPC